MIDDILMQLEELQINFDTTINTLKEYYDTLDIMYKNEYIHILFEYYSSYYEFYELDDIDTNDSKDICLFMESINEFINKYSKLLQFLDFTQTNYDSKIWLMFEKWKNIKLDLKESY